MDAWLTFVRETSDAVDPVVPLILGQKPAGQTALIVSRSGRRVAISSRLDADAVRSSGVWTNVIAYTEGIRKALVETLREIDPRNIAINFSLDDAKADGLTHGMYLLLQQQLTGTPYADRLVSAVGIIGALRGRKTATEIARIRKAVEHAEAILDETGRFMTIGTTEAEIADFIRRLTRERGLETAWDPSGCPIVNAGAGSMTGHGVPSTLAVRRGQLVHIDFGVRCDGYCSDLQRMWYVLDDGETRPPDKVQGAFDVVVEAIRRSADAITPGMAGWEIDAIGRRVVVDAGYPDFPNALGHSVGRRAHDGGTGLFPRWEKFGQRPYGTLEAGNTFTIEPCIHDVAGRGCLGVEEMVLVTDHGCRFLSTPQTALRLLP